MKAIATAFFFILIAPIIGIYIYGAVYTSKIESEFPATGKHMKVNHAAVHVVHSGTKGTPIFLIHGAGANAREFELSLMPRLDDNHQVLMADRPGHGYSDRLKDSHRLNVQAAQMAGALEQALNLGEKAVIVGHSFGAPVSLRLALDRPDLVKSVVLIAPVSHDWGPGKVDWFYKYASTPIFGHVFSQLMPLFGPSQARNGLSQTFYPAPEPKGYYDNAGIGLMFRPSSFRANAKDITAFRDELIAQQDRYGELKIPIIVISGSADTSINPVLQNTKLKQQAPHIQIIDFPNEGHVPHVRRADDVAEIISNLAITE